MFEEIPPETPAQLPAESNRINLLFKLPEAFTDIPTYQIEDPSIQKIVKALKSKNLPPDYYIQEGILTHKTANQTKHRVVIPERLIPLLFKYYHLAPTTAHLGINKT
jgi:hypothetical protein